jgi:hypothetical protein
MLAHRKARFESLERRLALAVTAAVVDGDLVVSGDADGDVVITADGSGGFTVTDNGNTIADNTTLTGVNDDIRINIDQSAGADNNVALDLATQTVDQISARLGDGANTFSVTGGGAASLNYNGGSGADDVTLDTPVSGNAHVKLGDGVNSLSVNADVNNLHVKGGADADTVTIAASAAVTHNLFARLGDGDNVFTLEGSVGGQLFVDACSGDDTVTLAAGSSVDSNVRLALGGGNNSVSAAGTIGGSLKMDAGAGNDTLTIAATAQIADDVFARLGGGTNSVTHDGNVGGDFTVLTASADDIVTIAPTAVIGGDTNLRIGEQRGNLRGHGCGAGHGLSGNPTNVPPAATIATQVASLLSRLRR